MCMEFHVGTIHTLLGLVGRYDARVYSGQTYIFRRYFCHRKSENAFHWNDRQSDNGTTTGMTEFYYHLITFFLTVVFVGL